MILILLPLDIKLLKVDVNGNEYRLLKTSFTVFLERVSQEAERLRNLYGVADLENGFSVLSFYL